jgi:PAS domain S-box-containing protein
LNKVNTQNGQSTLRILLVEDNEHDVAAFRYSFKKSGVSATVEHYSRAEDAEERLLSDPNAFDVLVTDYMLPGMNGLDLCQKLLEKAVDIPLVILTGTGSEIVAAEALKAGVYDYLVKDPDGGYQKLVPVVLGEVVLKHADRLARKEAEQALLRSKGELEVRVAQRTAELEQLNEDLQKREHHLKAIISGVIDGIITIDEKGIVLSLNPAAEGLFQYQEKDAVGRNVTMLMQDDAALAHNRAVQAYLGGAEPKAVGIDREVTAKRKDGSLFPMSIAVSEVKTEDGSLFTAIVRDIAQRKKAEEALKRAADEARAASRTKSDFLANMSHELRTPLNAIIGFSDTIEAQIFGPLENAKYLEYIGDIKASGEHLLSVIGDILDVSRIETGKMEVVEEPVDFKDAINGALRLVRERAKGEQIIIEVDISDELPRFLGDERRFKQIMLNLLSNAIKFTLSGGRVAISVEPQKNGGLEVVVSDTGIGMTKKELAKALQPFGQVDSAMAKRYPGSGLGLPLVKGLSELQGGVFSITSEKGKGTRAAISFPKERVIAL